MSIIIRIGVVVVWGIIWNSLIHQAWKEIGYRSTPPELPGGISFLGYN